MDPDTSQCKTNYTPQIFTYQPLNPPDAIRLLDIVPLLEEPDGILQIRLRQSEPTEPYRCLSYMWGDQTKRIKIHVNGQKFYVGQNVYDFLLYVAGQPEVFHSLWIDAICINQADENEKSIQVQQMGDIYSQAQETIVWLGFGTRNELRAMERLASERALRVGWDEVEVGGETWKACIPQLTNDPIKTHETGYWNPNVVADVVALLSNHYWKRAWIIQEVLLSQNLVVWCGFQELAGGVLPRLSRFIFDNFLEVEQKQSENENIGIIRRMTFDLILAPYTTLIDWGAHNTRRYFHELLKSSRECADPRDRIFSLVSTAKQDVEAPSIICVDYSKSAAEVFEMVWNAEKHLLGRRSNKYRSSSGYQDFASELKSALRLHDDERTKNFLETEFAGMGFSHNGVAFYRETGRFYQIIREVADWDSEALFGEEE